MGKAPSEATQLRTIKRELKAILDDREKLKMLSHQYRERATKAEQECAEWKARFDALLLRTPEVRTNGVP